MKKIFFIMAAILSTSLFAHTIEGTLILKGAIKTKITLNNLKTTCRVKVEKVKNLMEEDSFGNPAYNVRVSISLSGSNSEGNQFVDFDKEFWFNNLFKTSTGTEVRDLEYASPEGARLMINNQGRLKSVTFPTQYKTVTCSF